MRKLMIVVMACAIGLSFSGLTIAADETKPPPVSSADDIRWIASADDIRWIARCMDDNRNQGQPAEVVWKYCECMVSRMDTDETQSVTQWERKNPRDREECGRVAGWK